MARALYDPQHGYYTSGRARIGRKGDYFTSVSVGPLFGTLLARQFVEMWEILGRPEPFDLVEQGAHDGSLAVDVIGAIRRFAPSCAVRLMLVEPSAHWRAKQEARAYGCDVRWFDTLDSLPAFAGVHYSNELLDAFPVHLLRQTEAGLRERFVTCQGDQFVFVDRGFSSPVLAEYVAGHLRELPAGTVTEVNLAAREWVGALSRKLLRGFASVVDYGASRAEYYAPHRITGTLEAIGDHRREADPLARPGELDLTAHVDFTSLSEAAEEGSMRVAGFTDQHHFLVGLSRLHFREGHPPDPREARAFQTLSHPTMLGRAFKVLCLVKGEDQRQGAGGGGAREGECQRAVGLSGFSFATDARAALGLA